jgi:hypothetical protein
MVGDVEITNGHVTIESAVDRCFKRFRHARTQFRDLLSLMVKSDFDPLAVDDPYAATDVVDTTDLEEGCCTLFQRLLERYNV